MNLDMARITIGIGDAGWNVKIVHHHVSGRYRHGVDELESEMFIGGDAIKLHLMIYKTAFDNKYVVRDRYGRMMDDDCPLDEICEIIRGL
jgi:hypothetical protein